jgi:hypothetical protein
MFLNIVYKPFYWTNRDTRKILRKAHDPILSFPT